MNKKLEWIDAEDFFKKMVKKAKRSLLFFVQPMNMVGLILGVATIYYLGMNIYLGLGLLFPFFFITYSVTTGIAYYDFVEATRRRDIDKYLLECRWCNSYFSQEIWKEIARYLAQESIKFSIEVPVDEVPFTANVYDLFLKKEGIKISVYGRARILSKRSRTWISLGYCKSENEEYFAIMEELKNGIKEVIRKMPEENPFCKRCLGKEKSNCYGPKISPEQVRSFNKILDKIDPYKDDATLKYLIDLKERVSDIYPTKENRERFEELADTTETYKDIVYNRVR